MKIGTGRLIISTVIGMILIFLTSGLQAQTVYIKASQIFDGKNFLGAGIITVNNGLIDNILPNYTQIPDSVQFIDASDCTILPGFIDSHIHFMGASLPFTAEIEKHSFGKLAVEGISLFPAHRLHLLMNGITSIIDMGSPISGYRRYRDAISNGTIIGPELYYPGPLITAPKGHPAATHYNGQHDLILNGTFQVKDKDKAKEKIIRLEKQDVDFIKIVYDRLWYLEGGAPRLDLSIAKVIVEESHKLDLKVFAHVGSEEEALDMAGIDVDGIEHGFGISSDSIFKELKKRDISFTPTLSAYGHYAPKAVPAMQKTIRRASELGISPVVGTDYPASYGNYCGDDIFKEMNILDELGIARTEILSGATYSGAKKIGKENIIGSIKKGYRANLIIYSGRADTGKLSSSRIKSTILHGNIVIDKGNVVKGFSSGFRRKTFMIFPYGFYDIVSGFNMGLSYTNFDILNSGTSLYGDLTLSTKIMWSANLRFFIPSPIRKTSLGSAFHFDNLYRLYYGIGNNTLKENQIEYSAISIKENISATTTWNKLWKLNYSLSFEQFKTTGIGELLPSDRKESEMKNQSLLSVSFIFDSRDHQNNPWKGAMISVTPEFSSTLFGSNNDFGRMTIDARGYMPLSQGYVLGARCLYRQAFGDIPFNFLPDYGGPFVGRGYYISRFIDRAGFYGQAEFRFRIWKLISGAAFYDAGQVQHTASGFRLNDFHHSAGFGPRFNFGSNENSILGIDFGFSDEGMMVFFRAGHSF